MANDTKDFDLKQELAKGRNMDEEQLRNFINNEFVKMIRKNFK